MASVSATIQWPEALGSLPGHVRVRVSVEDSTLADASSVVVAETVLEDVSPGAETVVVIDVDEVEASADLSVRVQVSPTQGASRDLQVGDLVSTQSHPVLTHGHGDSVVVPLTLVGG